MLALVARIKRQLLRAICNIYVTSRCKYNSAVTRDAIKRVRERERERADFLANLSHSRRHPPSSSFLLRLAASLASLPPRFFNISLLMIKADDKSMARRAVAAHRNLLVDTGRELPLIDSVREITVPAFLGEAALREDDGFFFFSFPSLSFPFFFSALILNGVSPMQPRARRSV